MTEVVAALIWDQDKFMICQRPAHKARGLLSDNETKFDLLNNEAIAKTVVKATINLSQLEFMEIGEQENPVFLK